MTEKKGGRPAHVDAVNGSLPQTSSGGAPVGAPGARAGPVIACDNLVHIYSTGDEEVVALRGADMVIAAGESVALLGPSGAGKSTLLWSLAGLLRPSAGTVRVLGADLGRMSTGALARLRARSLGVVLQNPPRNLLPYATAAENVAFGGRSAAKPRPARRAAIGDLLDAVGLTGAAHRRAGVLSGGEQQRLALAVALAGRPEILLADEPTSQLDPASGDQVIDLLRWAGAEYGTTIVVVTHDPAVSGAFARTITIRDGRVGAEGRLGEEFAVVGRDATLQLPPDLHEEFPPGTLVRIVRTDHGAELHRVREEEAP